jgi:hypothetical protein
MRRPNPLSIAIVPTATPCSNLISARLFIKTVRLLVEPENGLAKKISYPLSPVPMAAERGNNRTLFVANPARIVREAPLAASTGARPASAHDSCY